MQCVFATVIVAKFQYFKRKPFENQLSEKKSIERIAHQRIQFTKMK